MFRSIIDYLNDKISTLDPKTPKEKIQNATAAEGQKIAKRLAEGNLTPKEQQLKKQFQENTKAKKQTLKVENKKKMGSRYPGVAPKPKKSGP